MLPPITALMITKGRLEIAKQAILDYQKQTYPARQLLIVTDGELQEIDGLRTFTQDDPSISLLHLDSVGLTLGELRNISLRESKTDWTIQWDDDDWYHPDRMEYQMRAVRPGKVAVLLREQLHYRRDTGEVSWISTGGIDGTILYNRSYGLQYQPLGRSEDSYFAKTLADQRLIETVPGGIRYCRTYHGANTWGLDHHLDRMRIFGLKGEKALARMSELQEAAAIYGWRSNWRLVEV